MSQENFKIRSIKPVVINPSIMEGEILYTSILGPDAAVPINRYAPINLTLPTISGSFKIPSTLTVNNGVWDGSPSPYFTYQWKANGVPIQGATGKTFDTYIDLDDMEMSADVTATSSMGSVTVTSSNTILLSVIQPVDINEISFGSITGLNQDPHMNSMGHEDIVASGLWVDNRVDTVFKLENILTGLWVDTRVDTMADSLLAIEGVGATGRVQTFEHDFYTVTHFEYLANLPLVNPGFETGNLTGWNQTPNANPNKLMRIQNTGSHTGTYNLLSPADTGTYELWQNVPLPDEYFAEIDSGNMIFETACYHAALQVGGSDSFQFYYGFYNAAGIQFATLNPYLDYIYPKINWAYELDSCVPIPAGTRTIRLVIKMRCQLYGTDVRLDNIQMRLLIAVQKNS